MMGSLLRNAVASAFAKDLASLLLQVIQGEQTILVATGTILLMSRIPACEAYPCASLICKLCDSMRLCGKRTPSPHVLVESDSSSVVAVYEVCAVAHPAKPLLAMRVCARCQQLLDRLNPS